MATICTALVLCSAACGKGKKAAPPWEIEKKYAKGPVELALRISKKSITIAERTMLELDATSPQSTEIEMPRFGEKLEQFGIPDYSAPTPELLPDGKMRTRRSYTLEPFLSGEYRVPPMAVKFKEKGTTDEHEILTEEVTIQVKSLLPSEVKKLEIKDIAGPEEMSWKIPNWLMWGLPTALLIAIAAAFSLWLKRRRQKIEELRKIPAHEIAYSELERLLSEGLIEKGEIKAFYGRVSGILRHYIEDRFGLKAPERTTEEFLLEIGSSDVLEPSWKTILERFLLHCDMVKFAELQPDTSQIQATFDTCKDFIEATKVAVADEKTAAVSG